MELCVSRLAIDSTYKQLHGMRARVALKMDGAPLYDTSKKDGTPWAELRFPAETPGASAVASLEHDERYLAGVAADSKLELVLMLRADTSALPERKGTVKTSLAELTKEPTLAVEILSDRTQKRLGNLIVRARSVAPAAGEATSTSQAPKEPEASAEEAQKEYEAADQELMAKRAELEQVREQLRAVRQQEEELGGDNIDSLRVQLGKVESELEETYTTVAELMERQDSLAARVLAHRERESKEKALELQMAERKRGWKCA
jgi:hypothetical protein